MSDDRRGMGWDRHVMRKSLVEGPRTPLFFSGLEESGLLVVGL